MLEFENIGKYTIPLSKAQVDLEVVEISKSNINNFFDIIQKRVMENGLSHAVDLLKNYLLDFEEFDLEFNINNMEINQTVGKMFKSVKEIL